jgi:hypothetical protein
MCLVKFFFFAPCDAYEKIFGYLLARPGFGKFLGPPLRVGNRLWTDRSSMHALMYAPVAIMYTSRAGEAIEQSTCWRTLPERNQTNASGIELAIGAHV